MRMLHHVSTAFLLVAAVGLAIQWVSPWIAVDVLGWAMLVIGVAGELFFGLIYGAWRFCAWATGEAEERA